MIRFGRNRVGDWVLVGPVAEVRLGDVDVLLKSGVTISETVVHLGKPFLSPEGERLRYGYLIATERRPKGRSCAECGYRPTVTRKADRHGIIGPVCSICKRADPKDLDFSASRL